MVKSSYVLLVVKITLCVVRHFVPPPTCYPTQAAFDCIVSTDISLQYVLYMIFNTNTKTQADTFYVSGSFWRIL